MEEEERSLVRENLLPLLPESWHEQMICFVEKPFENQIREKSVRRTVTSYSGRSAFRRQNRLVAEWTEQDAALFFSDRSYFHRAAEPPP